MPPGGPGTEVPIQMWGLGGPRPSRVTWPPWPRGPSSAALRRSGGAERLSQVRCDTPGVSSGPSSCGKSSEVFLGIGKTLCVTLQCPRAQTGLRQGPLPCPTLLSRARSMRSLKAAASKMPPKAVAACPGAFSLHAALWDGPQVEASGQLPASPRLLILSEPGVHLSHGTYGGNLPSESLVGSPPRSLGPRFLTSPCWQLWWPGWAGSHASCPPVRLSTLNSLTFWGLTLSSPRTGLLFLSAVCSSGIFSTSGIGEPHCGSEMPSRAAPTQVRGLQPSREGLFQLPPRVAGGGGRLSDEKIP